MTSTALTLIVVPLLYRIFEPRGAAPDMGGEDMDHHIPAMTH